MNQAVEPTKTLLNLRHGARNLLRVGDVELNNLAHVAKLGQFAGGALRQRQSSTSTRQGDGGTFLERTLGNAESDGVVGEDASDEDAVISEKTHVISVPKLNRKKGRICQRLEFWVGLVPPDEVWHCAWPLVVTT